MKYFYTLTLFAFPVIASAQGGAGAQGGVFKLLELVSGLIAATVPVVIGLAVLVFVWGILKYVVAKSDDDQKEAKRVILWGVIVLFVMVSIWGLVNLLGDTLNLNTKAPEGPAVPRI
ncbi:MAG: pilin [bacterium]